MSLHLPGAAEPIPVAGFGVMTGIFSLVGIIIAFAVRRWAARPAERWVQVARGGRHHAHRAAPRRRGVDDPHRGAELSVRTA